MSPCFKPQLTRLRRLRCSLQKCGLQQFKSLVLLAFVSLAIGPLSGCNRTTPPPKPGSTGAGKATAGSGGITEPAAKQLSKADYATAIQLKNRGIAHLENKDWAEAETDLAQLADLLPGNLLAQRNLAISRVLAIIDRGSTIKKTGTPELIKEFQQAQASAIEAIESYRGIATDKYDKALCDLLFGKLYTDSSQNKSFFEGLASLGSAADTMPEAADFRFAHALAMDGHRDYSDINSPKYAQLLTALQKSLQLAPENLSALQKLMQRQAYGLRSTNSDVKKTALQLTDTLERATVLLVPLNESIKKRRNRDLVADIKSALAEFDGEDPAPLARPTMNTANLLLPELATQIDLRRLNKNLLEYLVLDFDADFVKAASDAGAFGKTAPTVVKALVPTKGLPDLTGVSQVEFIDINLDGFDDMVVAANGTIKIYSRGTDLNGPWKAIISAPEAGFKLTRFLLVDIDRDYDRAVTATSPLLLRDEDGDQKIPKDAAGKNRWYDTDVDIVAWGENGCVVLRNDLSKEGVRVLNVVPQEESIDHINDVVAADLEADGDLDLIFATDAGMSLWTNIDGSKFENSNSAASLPEGGMQSLVVVDWNSDVAVDVVGLTKSGTVGFLENMFHGRYRWVSDIAKVSRSEGLAWRLVMTGGEKPTGIKVIAAGLSGSGAVFNDHIRVDGQSAIVADIDNNGVSDVVSSNNGTLTVATTQPGSDSIKISGLADHQDVGQVQAVDIDDDGDLDIVYISTADGSLALLDNDGGNTNNWIDVVARAVPNDPQFPSNRVNMHAIGSVIEVKFGGLYHREVINGPKLHLGLGQLDLIDVIRIIWTDGIPQNITVTDLLRQRIGVLAPQILKGSCPYIYTWTGERFEFLSDCLWAAPIGLVQANGEIAPTREWENLLIPGEALVQNEGRYRLQLTEELWETAYFDQVQLTAIDHPADVQIFTNEKVGPPDMAAHRVHTVKNPRLPKSVTDSRGRDLKPGLAAQDGNYIQAFEGRVLQGLTDEWTMEFDLGDLSSPKNVRLFLIGWIFPTDTSLNVGIAQNPQLDPPAPPAIEVPDGNGGWKTVRPFIGFPSGKTKAMVVDITDVFDGQTDYRFRLKSSMELYWDHVFFTVDEDDAKTVSQACPLANSDLQFRGFSRRTYADNALFRNGHAPEGYDHAAVTTDPRWPPISGRFTRYGDADQLLNAHDDQMVVMGPGDALTVDFTMPEKPVPAGWKRDFVLRNVGYDKDADLNTIYGQSSEPFPFRAMSRYPFAKEDVVPNTPGYLKYLDEWQTREFTKKPFWNAVQQRD